MMKVLVTSAVLLGLASSVSFAQTPAFTKGQVVDEAALTTADWLALSALGLVVVSGVVVAATSDDNSDKTSG